MAKSRSELLLILRDEAGCYYFDPDKLWFEPERWFKREHIDIPRGKGKSQSVKIMARRGISVTEDAVKPLEMFVVSRKRKKGQFARVTVRPFLVDFTGVLPSVTGLVDFDDEAEFYTRIVLPPCSVKAA